MKEEKEVAEENWGRQDTATQVGKGLLDSTLCCPQNVSWTRGAPLAVETRSVPA